MRALLAFLPKEIPVERVYEAMGTTRGAMSSVSPDLRLSLAVRMADAAGADRMDFIERLVVEAGL